MTVKSPLLSVITELPGPEGVDVPSCDGLNGWEVEQRGHSPCFLITPLPGFGPFFKK